MRCTSRSSRSVSQAIREIWADGLRPGRQADKFGGMTPFELVQPASLPEALRLLAAEETRPLSGGTALMLMMKVGMLRPARLVSLARCGLSGIEVRDGTLRVVAMTTLRELERSPDVRKGW